MNEIARLKRVPRFGNAGTVNNLVDQAVVRLANRLAHSSKRERSDELTAEDLVPTPVQEGQARKQLEKLVGLDEIKKTFTDLDALLAKNRQREAEGLPAESPASTRCSPATPGRARPRWPDSTVSSSRRRGFLSDGEVIEVTPKDLIGHAEGDTEKKVQELLQRPRARCSSSTRPTSCTRRGAATAATDAR